MKARRRFAFLAIAVCSALPGCKRTGEGGSAILRDAEPSGGAQSAPAAVVQSAELDAAPAPIRTRTEPELRQAGELAYLEVLTGGAREQETLPLIVAIHGLGDSPDQFAGFVSALDAPARIVLPRGTDSYGDGYSWFEFGNGRDMKLIARGVERATERLARAVAQIAHDRPTRGRPVVTGFSQGGILSFALAALHPELVSAAYPLAGAFPAPLFGKIHKSPARPPIVALHGEADAVIPLADAKRTVSELEARGFDVKLETFPGVQHTPSLEMGVELYKLLRAATARIEK